MTALKKTDRILTWSRYGKPCRPERRIRKLSSLGNVELDGDSWNVTQWIGGRVCGMSSSSRAEDARRREELAAAAQRNEAAAAQVLVDEFVATAKQRGLVPEPLRAHLMDGTRVKSDQVGWYLNKARTLAIAPDGKFYQLLTTGGWLTRFTGVKLTPSLPPLVVGRGGRDGETGDLSDFLARALEDYTPL